MSDIHDHMAVPVDQFVNHMRPGFKMHLACWYEDWADDHNIPNRHRQYGQKYMFTVAIPTESRRNGPLDWVDVRDGYTPSDPPSEEEIQEWRRKTLGSVPESMRGPRPKTGRPRSITADEVSQIRKMREEGALYKQIAAQFGISESHVGLIVRREIYGDVG